MVAPKRSLPLFCGLYFSITIISLCVQAIFFLEEENYTDRGLTFHNWSSNVRCDFLSLWELGLGSGILPSTPAPCSEQQLLRLEAAAVLPRLTLHVVHSAVCSEVYHPEMSTVCVCFIYNVHLKLEPTRKDTEEPSGTHTQHLRCKQTQRLRRCSQRTWWEV